MALIVYSVVWFQSQLYVIRQQFEYDIDYLNLNGNLYTCINQSKLTI